MYRDKSVYIWNFGCHWFHIASLTLVPNLFLLNLKPFTFSNTEIPEYLAFSTATVILSHHSSGTYSSAYRDCMLFNNLKSQRTVKHRQRCWLKRVMKLISHMVFWDTLSSLCLEMSEWQLSSTVVKQKQQWHRNIMQWNQTGNIWQIIQNMAPTTIPRGIYG